MSLALAFISCDKKEPVNNDGPAPASTVSVINVKLDKNTAKMTVGETMKLTATVYPDGTVTALSVGRFYIICTTEDQKKTDRCMIDVEAPVVKVTGVSFDVNEVTVNEGDSFPLKPVFKPSDATDKAVTWESDDPAIASVNDEGVVTAVKTGATTVSRTTKDDGFSLTFDVVVTYYAIYVDGKEHQNGIIQYKMGTNQNNIVKFKMFDHATKSFVKITNLKIESSDPTTAVVDSYTDTECLVRIKKNGLASLACYDVSAGVECYINNVLIASSN